jgi:hypothetical protein
MRSVREVRSRHVFAPLVTAVVKPHSGYGHQRRSVHSTAEELSGSLQLSSYLLTAQDANENNSIKEKSDNVENQSDAVQFASIC